MAKQLCRKQPDRISSRGGRQKRPWSYGLLASLCLSLPLLLGSAAASADRGGHGYRGYHGGYHHYRPKHHRGYRHYRHSRHHRRHRRHDNDAAYLIGGLVVGSLLTHAWHRSYERDYYGRSTRVVVAPPQDVVYTRGPTRVVQRAPAEGRHFYRDLDGNCFERRIDENGNELLEELPPEACRW